MLLFHSLFSENPPPDPPEPGPESEVVVAEVPELVLVESDPEHNDASELRSQVSLLPVSKSTS
jgi:hypothetical protein